MRITGGILRGCLVHVPKGNIRPTTDMVREALFSILGNRIIGAGFLDLYAGSGVVGLEAWSRGELDLFIGLRWTSGHCRF